MHTEPENHYVYIEMGTYTKGDPYPEIDFSPIRSLGIYSKTNTIACSTEQVIDQINKTLKSSPQSDKVNYYYYVLRED